MSLGPETALVPGLPIFLPVGVALVFGFLCLGVTAIYLWILRPKLRGLGARGTAVTLSDVIIGAFPVSLALIATLPDWRPGAFVLVLACIGLLVIAVNPRVLIRLSGGPSPAYPHAQLLWHAEPAWWAVASGEAMKAAAIAASLPLGTTEQSREYAALWRQLAAEAGRIAIDNERSLSIAHRLRDLERKLVGWPTPPRKLAAALLLIVALFGGIPPAVGYALKIEPCAGAEWLLLAGRLLQATDGSGADTPLHTTLINAPGILLEDRSMGIDEAAASRVYPNARDVLVFYGFIAAHRRVTQVDDRVTIQADVFEFTDADGAHGWQAAINRAACQFSNETFLGPGLGLGLQIRRRDPDFPRIVEQVSWVTGNRRFVISHSFWERPPDHETILSLARQGVTASGGKR